MNKDKLKQIAEITQGLAFRDWIQIKDQIDYIYSKTAAKNTLDDKDETFRILKANVILPKSEFVKEKHDK